MTEKKATQQKNDMCDFMLYSLCVHRHTRLHFSTEAFLHPEKDITYSRPKTACGVTADSDEKDCRDG